MLSDYLLTTKRNLPTLPYFLSFIFLHFTFQAEKMRRFPLRKRDNDDNKEKRSPACIFRPVRCIFPFTSQIEGKQKSQREESLSLPFPVHSLCFPCSLELLCSSARKSATSLSISCFHFSDVFFIQVASGGAASCVSLPLSSLFSFPFSSLLVLTFFSKT